MSEAGWARVAVAQAGMISRPQLLRCLTDRKIDVLLSTGALAPCAQGVYLVRGAPLTYEASLWSAVLGYGGVLGFATGAHLWGMCDRPQRIEVIIDRRRHRRPDPAIRAHRIDLPSWASTIRNGLPVTSRRETALDFIGRLRPGEAHQVADRALQRGWLLPRDFDDRVRRQPGRIGNTRLRIIAQSAGDGAAAHSERVLHRILRDAGIKNWRPNLDVWHDGELVAVLDVAFESARLAIELDGMAWHVGADRFQRDRTRQNDLVGLGWTVLRFTWSDLVNRPGYVVATIRRHLANSGQLTPLAGV